MDLSIFRRSSRKRKVMAMIVTQPSMTLEDYLNYHDGSDTRYELVDGMLVEMLPESTLNTQVVAFLVASLIHSLSLIFHPFAISDYSGE